MRSLSHFFVKKKQTTKIRQSWRWSSNPSGKRLQERLTRGAVTSTMRMATPAAHPSGCARCGAGAGCSPIRYLSLMLPPKTRLFGNKMPISYPPWWWWAGNNVAQGRSTQIISMMKWVRTSMLSIKKSLSLLAGNNGSTPHSRSTPDSRASSSTSNI